MYARYTTIVGHFLQSAPTFLSPLITPRLLGGGTLSLYEMPAFDILPTLKRWDSEVS